MLSKLELTLENPYGKLDYNISSLLQGALMEQIRPEYAEVLHEGKLNPYSQCVRFGKDKIVYTVNTLNKGARGEIILPLLENKLEKIHLRHKALEFKISSKLLVEKSYGELIEETYLGGRGNYLEFDLYTPTAFKRGGKYHFYPDTELIFKNLIMRFDGCTTETTLYDEELIQDIRDKTEIVNYDVRSARFHLEGIRIPGFVGRLGIRASGTKQFSNLLQLLIGFGEFAGVGIKTSIGMGAMKRVERKENR
ncbi:MAG: CRISPR system precrRNA processing endoribonuclease RAMP protein Cas6 [Anaerovoracaceae bacterium]